MNSRPILIATCCAIALVAFVYFFGRQQFSEPAVDGSVKSTLPQPSGPTTVGTPKPTTETTDGGNTVGKSKTKTPTQTLDELRRKEAELRQELAESVRDRDALKKKIAGGEQLIAKYEAEQKASEEQEKQIMAELEVFNQWLDTEILPEVDTLLPDLEVFLDGTLEPTVEAYVKRFPDPADQRYYANKLARYKVNQDKLVDYLVNNTSKVFQERFINDAIADWGEERSKYIVNQIRKKQGGQ